MSLWGLHTKTAKLVNKQRAGPTVFHALWRCLRADYADAQQHFDGLWAARVYSPALTTRDALSPDSLRRCLSVCCGELLRTTRCQGAGLHWGLDQLTVSGCLGVVLSLLRACSYPHAYVQSVIHRSQHSREYQLNQLFGSLNAGRQLQGERGWRRGMTLSGRELVVFLTTMMPGLLPDDLEFFFAMLGMEYADPKATLSFNQLFLVRIPHPCAD